MKKLLFIFLILATTLGSLSYHRIEKKSSSGTIILLNGPSTAGKSSVKKELQKLFSTPYLNLGIDTLFIGVLPERFVTGQRLDHDIDHTKIMNGKVSFDAHNNRLYTLNIGTVGNNIIEGMHHAIAAYAENKNNCIIDYILYDNNWIPSLCDALASYKVYTIRLTAPLELLEAREKERGFEFVQGHVRSHYHEVHQIFDASNAYDLALDTQQNSASEAAEKIHNFILTKKHPSGFKNLIKQHAPSLITRIMTYIEDGLLYFRR